MGIYIKGMEMPTSGELLVIITPNGEVSYKKSVASMWDITTAVPVPPHGRLIDAGELTRHEFTGLQADKKISYQMGWNDALMVVAENAPTIIPAEESEI